MTYTTDDLTRIKGAIASGELEVTLDDGSKVRYRTIEELRRAQRAIEAELDAASGASPKRRGFVTHTTKGVY